MAGRLTDTLTFAWHTSRILPRTTVRLACLLLRLLQKIKGEAYLPSRHSRFQISIHFVQKEMRAWPLNLTHNGNHALQTECRYRPRYAFRTVQHLCKTLFCRIHMLATPLLSNRQRTDIIRNGVTMESSAKDPPCGISPIPADTGHAVV